MNLALALILIGVVIALTLSELVGVVLIIAGIVVWAT